MWDEIVKEFTKNPRDVHTVPMNNKKPRWFFVYTENGKIYIDEARNHVPSSSLKQRLVLHKDELEIMKELYKRRKLGEKVSKLAIDNSRMSVYWYGIFADLNI